MTFSTVNVSKNSVALPDSTKNVATAPSTNGDQQAETGVPPPPVLPPVKKILLDLANLPHHDMLSCQL